MSTTEVTVACGQCKGGPVYMYACPEHAWVVASECRRCGLFYWVHREGCSECGWKP